MSRTILVTTILATLIGLAGPVPGEPATKLTVIGATPAETDLAEWAAGRFATAGLDLPDLVVEFHADTAGCAGNAGLFTHSAPGGVVHLCTGRPPESLVSRRVALHELAHAWADHSLDAATRSRFTALRGLSGWDDATLGWEMKAAEHAAEVVTWALLEEEVLPVRLPGHDPESLRTAYQALTGAEPELRGAAG